MKKVILCLMIILPSLLFADDEYKKNSITLSAWPGIDSKNINVDYQRLFLDNHIGVSIGAGYIEDFQKSIIMPLRLTYIPFNFIIKPNVYAGVAVSYNWRDDVQEHDDYNPVFDKGLDLCFEWGVGLTVSSIFDCIKIGAHVRGYMDNSDRMLGFMTIEIGYMF